MDPSCDCGLPAVRRQCKNGKPQNVGRFFWGCPKSRDYGGCSFFVWEADDVPAIHVQPTGAVAPSAAPSSSSAACKPVVVPTIRRMANNEPVRRVGLPAKREMQTVDRDTYVGEIALAGRVDSLSRDRERDRVQLDNLMREVKLMHGRVDKMEKRLVDCCDAQPAWSPAGPEEGEIVD